MNDCLSPILHRNSLELRALHNVQIRSAVEDLLALFDPVSAALNVLQSDTATIADAFDAFVKLKQNQKIKTNENASAALHKYSEYTLSSPLFQAVYLLDPSYHGEHLNPNELESACIYIKSLHSDNQDMREALTDYISNSPPYNTQAIVRGRNWWKAGKRLGFNPLLCDLGIDMGACIASSAGLERSFSTMKLTYGEL